MGWFRTKSPNSNKLSFEEKFAYSKKGYLVISPSGDTQDFIFGPFEDNVSTGSAYFGITLDAHKYEGLSHFSGGVVGLEDCIRLRDHLTKHIEKMNQV